MSESARQRLARLLTERAGTAERYTSGFAQRRLWFLQQVAPDSAAYNVPLLLDLRGPLDRPALRAALHELAERHPALRTVLEAEDGEPVQVVRPAGFGLPLAERTVDGAAEADRLWTGEAARPFDLARETVRATLWCLGSEHHRLSLVLHHALADGRSLEVLTRELGLLYVTRHAGRPDELPLPPIRYADFAAWERRRARGAGTTDPRSHPDLDGLEPLELPADPQLVDPALAGRAARATIEVPAPLVRRLEEAARAAGCTPFAVLLACWGALLHRHTGQRVLALGTAVANRPRVETEGVVGCFANLVPLPLDLSGDPTFEELFVRVHRTVAEGLRHGDVPFERLVESLQPRPSSTTGTRPLVQGCFVLQPSAPAPPDFGEALEVRVLPSPPTGARFDVEIELWPVDGGWSGWLDVDLGRAPATLATVLANRFGKLLAAVAEAPGCRVSAVEPLSPADRHRLVTEWNDTAVARAPEASLGAAVVATVARRADAVAVTRGREHWSYRGLCERSSAVANRLVSQGLERGGVVAVLGERTPRLVAALLGILRAGGAYLPLDAALPPERLRWMVDDAGARLLAGDATAVPLAAELGLPLLRFDAPMPAPREAPAAPFVEPQDLAYVLYTSGSTGHPKAVALEHGNALSLVAWARRRWGAVGLDRVFASTAIGFDLSVFELFATLAAGGTVILGRDLLDVEELQHQRPTLLNTVPSVCEELLRLAELPPSVRHVNLAGERLRPGLVDRLLENPGVEAVDDLYGPTECATYATAARRASHGPETIGRPIASTRAHLLGPGLRLVPPEGWGELWLAGAGVARGYLRRPGLTADRFRPDPFAPEPGSRTYRTGDRARFLADGRLRFLGRLDEQVKLRGFRIEPGEVEEVLRSHPSVAEAAVGVRSTAAAGPRLAGWVEPVPGAALDLEALRRHCSRVLPPWMIPDPLAFLDRLPRTATGKLDRLALSLPTGAAEASRGGETARTPVEAAVVEAFRTVLGLGSIGVEDDFFVLGGHSLLAARLAARLRHTLGADLPLSAVFDARTPARLAQRVTEARRGATAGPLPVVPPADRSRPQPLTFAQERMWLLSRLREESAAYNVAVAIDLDGPLDRAALVSAVQQVTARHDVLRARFGERLGRPSQWPGPPPGPWLTVTDLASLPPEHRAVAADRLEAVLGRRPFRLAAEPPLRVLLVGEAAEAHRLLVVFHHIAADARSLGLFFGELGEHYAARRAGRPAASPALPVQLGAYARWERRRWQAPDEAAVEPWRQRLAELPALALPSDRPRPAWLDERGHTHRFVLAPAAGGGAVRELATAAGVTPFMVMLAAFGELLGHLAGQRDLAVATPVTQREPPAAERLIGPLLQTLVLRLDLSGDPSFHELLRRARATTLEAFDHSALPFEALLEHLEVDRASGFDTLFQAMLVFHSDAYEELELPGVEARRRPLDTGGARTDVTLFCEPAGGGLACAVEGRRELFDATGLRRFAAALETLLVRAAAHPGLPTRRLHEPAPAQRHQILYEWGPAPVAPPGVPVHERFRRQAGRTPEAVAVESRWGALSFEALDRWSDVVALRLAEQGVGPEDVVGVSLPRRPGLVAALLGVLKAGAAWLPLDPGHPAERRRRLVAASGAAAVIVDDAAAKGLPPGLLRLRLPSPATGDAASPTRVAVGPHHLSHVIPTSGSTGEPKCVAVTHGGVSTLLDWAEPRFRPEERSGVAAVTSIAFDLSVFELFLPLTTGGRSVLLDDALTLVDPRLSGAVSLVNTVPSAMAELVRLGSLPRAVRTVCLAGEPLATPLVEALADLGVGRILDLYGPSESTTYATWTRRLPGEPPQVGRPIDGTRLHVLDDDLAPVGTGAPGEVVLGGVGLARGYVGRPGETAQRFVPDPFGSPGDRLYRTGDRGRRWPDGRLQLLGRQDRQVKLRGFRIELDEVENALAAHPGLREAAVGLTEDSGQRRLTAWVVPAGAAATADPGPLAAWLGERLPRFMVPAVFHSLPELPRLPNGKLNRKALSGVSSPAAPAGARPPATPLEGMVAAAWQEVMGRGVTDVRRSLFDDGGDSLRAARLVARLEEAFGQRLSLQAVLREPTVESIAARLASGSGGAWGPRLPPLLPGAIGGPAPLTAGQRQIWFLHQVAPESPVYNVPFALRLDGPLHAAALARALGECTRRHRSLRTRLVEVEGEPKQVVETTCRPYLRRIDLSALPAEVAEARALEEASREVRRPFRLDRAPLLRALLLRLGTDRHVLVLTLHHAVVDGWSLEVLMRDLAAHYARAAGHERGPAAPSAPPELGPDDYARWEESWLRSAAVAPTLELWRERLTGARHAVLPQPPMPERAELRGTVRRVQVPAETVGGLRKLGRECKATLFHVLLSAWTAHLVRAGAGPEVLLGVPLANRVRPELSGLVGFFANTVPVVVDLFGDPSAGEAVERAQEAMLWSQEHGWIPLERIVEALRLPRTSGRAQFFEAGLVMHRFEGAGAELPGLDSTYLPLDTGTAKFDLLLTALESDAGLSLQLEATAGRFSADDTARHLEGVLEILTAFGEQPESPLSRIAPAAFGRRAVPAPADPLERTLRALPSVLDAAVLERPQAGGTHARTAWVVLPRPGDADRLVDVAIADHGERPDAVVPVARIPRNPEGGVDWRTLEGVPVLDAGTVAEIESRARRGAPGEEVLAVVRTVAPEEPRIDLERLALADPGGDTGFDPGEPEVEDPPAYASGGPLELPADLPSTLVDALEEAARRDGDKGLRLLSSDGEEVLTYAELLTEARRIASGLAAAGAKPGEAAILQMASLRRHFPAFWGCMLAGLRPVNVALSPDDDPDNNVARKLLATWELLAKPRVLADRRAAPVVTAISRRSGKLLEVLAIEELASHPPCTDRHPATAGDVAFYQLTSGSTGVSKAIPEVHRAVIRHIVGSARFNGYGDRDVTLNWLPLDHVVPILTFHLKDVFLRCSQIHVEPALVLAEPLLWLDLMEKHRVTHTWAPNFGFQLVNRALAASEGRTWQLDCVRFCMNAGELVTYPVTREFAERTRAFGMPPEAMQPAFGMAEVCTCMTYQNAFDPERHAFHVERASFEGRLAFGAGTGRGRQSFIDLGPPMAGVEIRIAGTDGTTLAERRIGRLQIRGGVLTPGYHDNPEANRESFVADGWFDTGDLGFMVEDRLVVTGRAKEILIVNGANFSCYEIEGVVNRVEGVLPTWVGACGVRVEATGTEGLAVFFVPQPDADAEETVARIRREVIERIGLRPEVVVPLPRDVFPRTTSGKIQRTRLRKDLEAGLLDAHVPESERSASLVPHWFFRRRWRRALAPSPSGSTPTPGRALVLGEPGALTEGLVERLTAHGWECVVATAGPDFGAGPDPGGRSPAHVTLRPDEEDDYRRLFESSEAGERPFTHIVHLWTVAAAGPVATLDRLRRHQRTGLGALLALARALDRPSPVELWVVSRGVQGVRSDESVEIAHAAIPVTLRSIGQEIPWIASHHLDLERRPSPRDAERIAVELIAAPLDPEVALRGGARWVPRLERVDLGEHPPGEPLLRAGGRYLVTGGLGAVGAEVVEALLREREARLLVVGRTAAGDVAGLDRWQAMPGEVLYESADAADPVALEAAVSRAEAAWGAPLEGAFHLAGVLEERPVVDTDDGSLWRSLSPKAGGALALGDVLGRRPEAFFVAFSSVSAYFGGALVAAYAAANRFLEAFVHELRLAGRPAFCYGWSAWEGRGMSRGTAPEVVAAAGFHTLPPPAALSSLAVLLDRRVPASYVGVNGANPRIGNLLDEGPVGLQEVVLCSAGNRPAPPEVAPLDPFGVPIPVSTALVAEMPRDGSGAVDRQRLALALAGGRRRPPSRPPKSELERELAAIWRKILQVPELGVEDNFFDLGGSSMLLAQVRLQIERLVEQPLDVVELFRFPTVAALAAHLAGEREEAARPQVDLSRQADRRDRRRDRRRRRDEGRRGI